MWQKQQGSSDTQHHIANRIHPCIAQSSDREQQGQIYGCFTQRLYHQGTMHHNALSVARESNLQEEQG